MNDDLNAITLLDELLESENVSWNDKDMDTLEDDDDGNRIEFYTYYLDPKIPKTVNFNKIIQKYNKQNNKYKLTELSIINDELRAKFRDGSYKEESYLYY